MKMRELKIHNYRSIIDMTIETYDYTLLVGSNNAGKSTVLNAIRTFYDEIKWTTDDVPRSGASDGESWVQFRFELEEQEWKQLDPKYKSRSGTRELSLRRYFRSDETSRIRSGYSNIYAIMDGTPDRDLFYGARSVAAAHIGQIVYVPAQTSPAEHAKLSGPSPLRNIVHFLVENVVANSESFKRLKMALETFNESVKGPDGFFNELSGPLNSSLADWGVTAEISVSQVAPAQISKSLIRMMFVDQHHSGMAFELEQYGHGFQRSVIYELIRIAPSFKLEKANRDEFEPEFKLILFEEPEVFLHPAQQEQMAFHLRRLASEPGHQVIITTHSTTFVGRAVENIAQIARIQRIEGRSVVAQPSKGQISRIFDHRGEVLRAVQAYVDDARLSGNKTVARRMIADPPSEEIRVQEERFRFQLWLSGDRSAMFFADKVLLVEGETERALFQYLLENQWTDLRLNRICVVDALGKYNMSRYASLMTAYGIRYGIILDDDENKDHHRVMNELIVAQRTNARLGPPQLIAGCMEDFLGVPKNSRDLDKPIQMMKHIVDGSISTARLLELRKIFCRALAIDMN